MEETTGRVNATLGGLTSKATGEVLTATLHVDLVWTDLADIVEHIERDLRGGRAHELLGDTNGYWRLWGDESYPEKQPIKGWELMDTGRYIRMRPAPVGNTGMTYYILRGARDQKTTLACIVQAVRYRRDRLKVVVHERPGDGHRERMLAWLTARWGDIGDGIFERSNESAPDPEPPQVIETEADLRRALYELDTQLSTSEYWAAVSELFHAYKRANRRFTQAKLAEMLGYSDVKHVGDMLRAHPPRTPKNPQTRPPKSG